MIEEEIIMKEGRMDEPTGWWINVSYLINFKETPRSLVTDTFVACATLLQSFL